MTFRGSILKTTADGVPVHDHDASEISGNAAFLSLKATRIRSGSITGQTITVAGGADGVIRSDNFAAGSAGWQIAGDGSAEFNDVTVRGTIFATAGEIGNLDVVDILELGAGGVIRTAPNNSQRVEITGSAASAVFFYTGDPDEGGGSAGVVGSIVEGSGASKKLITNVQSPSFDAATVDAFITLASETDDDSTGPAQIRLHFDSGLTLTPEVKVQDGAKLMISDGTAAAPSFTFNNDIDTGIYRAGANQINIAAAGVQQVAVVNGAVRLPDGTAAEPGVTFINSTDDGMYRNGDGATAIATNATAVAGFYPGSLRPGADNAQGLGVTAFRWVDVWAVDGTINTSDARIKTDVAPIPRAVDLVKAIGARQFRRVDLDNDRLNFGFIAQDVATALNPDRFNAVHRPDGDDLWALRSDQLVPVLWAAFTEHLEECRA